MTKTGIVKITCIIAVMAIFVFCGAVTAVRDKRKIESDISAAIGENAMPEAAAGRRLVENTVNINIAAADELCTLSGIGRSRAEAIIKYREENGGFVSTEEIMQVKGIGKAIYENIRYNISV